MYETVLNLDEFASLLGMLAWLVTGHRARRIAYRPTSTARRRTARIVAGLLALCGLLLAAKLTSTVLLWATVGWPFAQNRVLVELPLLLAPVAAVAILALPRLRRVLGDPGRAEAADPRLVVPVRSAAVAATLGGWLAFVARPVPPYLPDLLSYGLLLCIVTALLWLRQLRRAAAMSGSDLRLPGIGRRALHAVGSVVAVVALFVGGLVLAAQGSVLPGTYSMLSHGGGSAHEHGVLPAARDGVSVTSLTGDVAGEPDRRFALTAQPTTATLDSGATVAAWTFNGQAPGPQLRVRQNELVEVTVVNELPDAGVTVHWHGVDLANAADGVAGLTQDAVQPGERYVHRFRAPDVGTYWYHSHQQSAEQTRRGLFGSLVVVPPAAPVEASPGDITVLSHRWDTTMGRRPAFDGADGTSRRTVPAGTPVRLRVVNTDNTTLTVTVAGAPFRVAAIDGFALNGPTDLVDTVVRVAAGGRDDLTFTMPDHPVLLAGVGFDAGPGLLLSPDGTGEPPAVHAGREFDPLSYGSPASTPFDATTPADKQLMMILDDGPGFYDGRFGFHSTINGALFPDTPMPVVAEGDLVRTTFVNRSHSAHPMHLHGHHMLVLSRNSVPVSGGPWWTDTLEVRPGETFVVAFRADNPGLWMDHCHNLDHAATGMTMHLAYRGVTTPYVAGRDTVNQPE